MENVRNLLYRQPELYELVVDDPERATARMCENMFKRFLPESPGSILDLGCGTGRDLDALWTAERACWGVDLQPQVIEYASTTRPHLRLETGDMRTVRLEFTFDAILCMGSALMYALTNEDLAATFATFAAHAHPGTLLVLDIQNAASYLGGGAFRNTWSQKVDVPGFKGEALVQHRFDRRRQVLIRTRTWKIEERGIAEDFCEYRLLFPQELRGYLEASGFRVLGMFDNKDLADSQLDNNRLYVAAQFGA